MKGWVGTPARFKARLATVGATVLRCLPVASTAAMGCEAAHFDSLPAAFYCREFIDLHGHLSFRILDKGLFSYSGVLSCGHLNSDCMLITVYFAVIGPIDRVRLAESHATQQVPTYF